MSLAFVPEAAAQYVVYDSGTIQCDPLAAGRVQVYQPQPLGLPTGIPSGNVSPLYRYEEYVYWLAQLEYSFDRITWRPVTNFSGQQLNTGWIYARTRKGVNLLGTYPAYWFHLQTGQYVVNNADGFGRFNLQPRQRWYRVRQYYYWPASSPLMAEKLGAPCYMH